MGLVKTDDSEQLLAPFGPGRLLLVFQSKSLTDRGCFFAV